MRAWCRLGRLLKEVTVKMDKFKEPTLQTAWEEPQAVRDQK
jgi:hypothetical protein